MRSAPGCRQSARRVLRPDDFAGELGTRRPGLRTVGGGWSAASHARRGNALRTMSAPLWLGEAEVYASPSIGIALFPGTADSAEALLQQARSACAAASALANHIALYDEGQNSRASLLVEKVGCVRRLRKMRSTWCFSRNSTCASGK